MNDSPLKGIRVVGLTLVWAGPWAGRVLADMGAEVIKIESRSRIDSMRIPMGPVGDQPEINKGNFNIINAGVKSCTLNLKQLQGIELFKRIVQVSDIVIENFPPRVMRKLGLDYKELRKIKDDIIMVSLSGFGGTGPDKDYVSYASTAESIGGYTASFGYPDGDPAPSSVYLADFIAGMYGAAFALAGLHHRKDTGEGLHIDIAQSEAVNTLIPETIMEYVMNGRIKPRMGNRDDIKAPHGCYPCKGDDKWIAIAVSTEEEWKALCRVMGNPEWSMHNKFSDQFSRWLNQDELDRLIAEWTRTLNPYDLMRILQEAGVAAGPSLNTEELVHDPHIRKRDAIFMQNHPEAGNIYVHRSPWISALTSNNQPAACFGEHNEYVFKKLLGMADDELSRLIDENVIY